MPERKCIFNQCLSLSQKASWSKHFRRYAKGIRKQVLCAPDYKRKDGCATNNKISTNPYCTISSCNLGSKSAHISYKILLKSIFGKITERPKTQLIRTYFASMDNFLLNRSCNWQADICKFHFSANYVSHLFKDTSFYTKIILSFCSVLRDFCS